MDPAGPQPRLRDLEATSFAEQDVRDRDAHVVEVDLAMAVGRVVVAEHGERSDHRDPGGVAWDQHHGLLTVTVGVRRVGLPHEDEDLAAWVQRARRPPFPPADDVLVSVVADLALDVRRIR